MEPQQERTKLNRSRTILTKVLLTLSCVSCISWFASAGEISVENDTTVLTLDLHSWVFPDPSKTDTATRADVAVAREFMKRFPSLFQEQFADAYRDDPARYGKHDWSHVEVRLRQSSGIQVEGVEADLLSIAGRVAPDILYVNFRKSDTYIQQGFLYPLDRPEDNYVTSMTEEELAFRVHPKIWPVIRRKGPGGAEHVWAIPYGGALGKVLLYRKDLFDAAGISYPTADWTWDDLHHAARALSDPARGVYGIRFTRGKHEAYHWTTFLWSMGADVLTYRTETDQWEVAFDVPEAAVALDFYTRLNTERWEDANGRVRRGYAFKDPSQALVKWRRGEIGMAASYIDEKMFSTINPDITGMAPVPKGPTGIRGAELNSRMMGLYGGIEEPAIRDAAWEYLRFFDSREAMAIRTRIMVEGGLGHFMNPRYLEMFGYSEIARLSPRGWKDTYEIAIASGRPEPYGKHSNIAYDILTEPIQEAEQLALAGKLPEDRDERLAVLHGLLQKAGDKARRDMLGVLPPDVQKQQRLSAGVFLVAVVIAFTFLFRKIARTFTPAEIPGTGRRGWQFFRFRFAYLLLIPAVATIFFWQYIPLVRGSIMAFQDYRILGGSQWVGLDNFGQVLWDVDWWESVWNALRYSFLVMALTFLPPIILAILLQEVPHGKIFFRTIFYLPAVITGLVVILLWKSFYDPSDAGVLNAILLKIPAVAFLAVGTALLALMIAFSRRLLYHDLRFAAAVCLAAGGLMLAACVGLAEPIFQIEGVSFAQKLFLTLPTPYRWLDDPRTAMIACVIPMAWAGMGPGCLIYLAALKGIADDFYEAADLDGATFIDKILFVVFPILRPLILINFIGVFIGSWFAATANILAMTGGAADTEVAGLHIFYKAFVFLQFGPATAMAWVLGFILIGFTIHQLKILSRLEFRAND